MEINIIEQKLKTKGYKLTNQRKALLEVFIEFKSTLLSAEEIFKKVVSKFSGTNFSTVYRNLDVFIECGIIHRININGNTSTYEMIDGDTHNHIMICKDCGKTEPLDFCPMEDILNKMDKNRFTLTDHKIELYGYCKKCNDKELSK